MTRGFITLATGSDIYYRMAYNLLRSFRLFDKNTPFAILCDRENEYTKEFSDAIILENVTNSYLDKFRLLTDAPYDENIFIEPDCLVYHDLRHFWDLLSGKYDFTTFGWDDHSLIFFSDPEYAMTKFLGSSDALVSMFNPGYLFIRNGDVCTKIYADAMRIIEEIKADPKLKDDPEIMCKGCIRDDPVFYLAMSKNECRCAQHPDTGKCISLYGIKKIRNISLSRGRLDASWWNYELTDCNILHFSTRRTIEEGLYSQQVLVLNRLSKGKNDLLTRALESRFCFIAIDLYKKTKNRIVKRLKPARKA
ncbi:MAG: hypothetical protein K6G90_12375 [Clostridia bacterium]|nr:hypothetical protein [Clostridia bacterium]